MSTRNTTIDSARSLAMLYIIAFWHLSGYSGVFTIPYGDYIKNAALGLFMLVSGYLLGAKYKIQSVQDAWVFIKKRFFRLYPLYALSLLLFWGHSAISTHTLLYSLIGVSSFIPPQPPTLWFVSMLLVFYVIFIFLSGRKKTYQILFSVLIYLFLFVICYQSRTIDHRLLYYFPCFFLGMIISDIPLNRWMRGGAGVIAIVLFITGIILLESVQLSFIPRRLTRCIIALTGSYFVFALARLFEKIPRINKCFIPLSYASMAAYMFHRQIFSAIRMVYWPEPSAWKVVFLYVVCVPIVLGIGYLVQFVYDKLLKRMQI